MTGPAATEAGVGKIPVTITFLEMSEAPPRHPAAPPPPGHRMALMRAEAPPVPFYRFLYNTVGDEWSWWERRAMDDATLRAIIEDDRVEIYVLYVAGAPAGYTELDRRQPGRVDIAFLGLMPHAIGKGYGRYLLDWALRRAWETGPDKVTINTCTLDHPRALAMYQRAGFVPVRRETRIIDDPAPLFGRQP